MSEKHTPGPWHAHHDHGWLVVESDNEELYLKVEKGSCARKKMPDALLIAAAPDLLEALESVLKAIEESDQWWMDCPDRGGFDAVGIRAAIARAKGEQE